MSLRIFPSLVFSGCLALILAAPARAAALKVVAAENFYGGIARQIGGDAAVVTSILTNPNQDPHEFTSNAETARAVADADVVIYNGIGYDDWMSRLVGTGGNTRRTVIVVAGLIGAKDGDNPHIWYAPTTMPALAQKLATLFSQQDPASAGKFAQRLQAFQAEMKVEQQEMAEVRKISDGVTVTATEPVFGYMAAALGCKMLNDDFQVKVMNDAEPTASETAAFERCLRSRQARILFYNSQVTDPTTARLQALARESHVAIVGVTETQPLDQPDYAAWMRQELAAVQAALSAKDR
jgi:zinc/manganese transport system substrate-binding protein